MKFDKVAFCARLKNAQLRSGKSGKEIEAACGFAAGYWNHLLEGNVILSDAQLFNLCIFLDVSADWLLGLKALREAEE